MRIEIFAVIGVGRSFQTDSTAHNISAPQANLMNSGLLSVSHKCWSWLLCPFWSGYPIVFK